MYSKSAKGGEKRDPNRNPWLAKMTLPWVKFKLKNFSGDRNCLEWQAVVISTTIEL